MGRPQRAAGPFCQRHPTIRVRDENSNKRSLPKSVFIDMLRSSGSTDEALRLSPWLGVGFSSLSRDRLTNTLETINLVPNIKVGLLSSFITRPSRNCAPGHLCRSPRYLPMYQYPRPAPRAENQWAGLCRDLSRQQYLAKAFSPRTRTECLASALIAHPGDYMQLYNAPSTSLS